MCSKTSYGMLVREFVPCDEPVVKPCPVESTSGRDVSTVGRAKVKVKGFKLDAADTGIWDNVCGKIRAEGGMVADIVAELSSTYSIYPRAIPIDLTGAYGVSS